MLNSVQSGGFQAFCTGFLAATALACSRDEADINVLGAVALHATKDLKESLSNILSLLRPDAFVPLVECTRNIFWFDLVFGLLDGWWLFDDGRKHPLADESFWETSMKRAGFKHVSWTCGDSPEANTLRIITGFSEANKLDSQRQNFDMETVAFKQTDQTTLYADIYYPSILEVPKQKPWRVGMKPPSYTIQQYSPHN